MTGVRVRARGWGWRHAGRSSAAVSGLDLDVAPGERVLLLGASGAGKSTLLHALAGVLGGDDEGERTGELTLDGVAPEAARGRAGLVLQDPDSQVVLARVGDDVAFACENLGVKREEIWRRVGEALDAVGLDVALDRPSSALSGGQTQRLALAGVLAMRPGLLLLDEPTANLDPDGVVQVHDAVAAACEREGLTLIVVEHRVEVWEDAVDRVVVLGRGGGVVADGSPDAVLRERGTELSASGVWVPGHAPVAGRPSGRTATADVLLSARGLAVGRVPFARKEPLVAASGLDLEVGAGRALAVTGPNGAGKSTLALTLAGLLAPIDGALEASPAFAAGARGSRPIRWRSRDLLTRIGTVFQEPEHQFLTSSVRAELEVGPRALRLPEAEIAARVDELLGRLRLDALADANPFTLSGGEKRRLSVATVLATRPRLLVLDEPSFGQDAVTWRELVLLLRRLVDEGSGVVAVTHDKPLVEAVADQEYRLGTGEAVRA